MEEAFGAALVFFRGALVGGAVEGVALFGEAVGGFSDLLAAVRHHQRDDTADPGHHRERELEKVEQVRQRQAFACRDSGKADQPQST